MGNGRSSLLGHQPMQVNIFHHGHHDGDKYKDKEAERKMGPVHVVGTVTSSEELLQAPFGRQRGVATQVSIYKNDGYPEMDAMEYLFTGTEAVKFRVRGHVVEKGVEGEPIDFDFDAEMSKITFKLKTTHLEQYIILDKKTRVLKSHAHDRKWENLIEQPLARLFWERHCSSSRKGDLAMLRSMLNAAIPIPRLAKERVLQVGDAVSILAQPLYNDDGSVTLTPTGEGRLVITNALDVCKVLGHRKVKDIDALIKANGVAEVRPMGTTSAQEARTRIATFTQGDDFDSDESPESLNPSPEAGARSIDAAAS